MYVEYKTQHSTVMHSPEKLFCASECVFEPMRKKDISEYDHNYARGEKIALHKQAKFAATILVGY